jgi:O-antigen/teichoic acid export membrane protein
MLSRTADPVLYALGKPRLAALASFLSFLFYAIGIPAGFHLFGPVGAVIAVATSNIPIWIVINYALHREKLPVFSQDLIMSTLLTGVLCCVLVIRDLMGFGLPFTSLF